MYALVDIQGKQYKAEKGTLLKIDRVSEKAGDVLEFDSVLMVSDDEDIKIGQPYVEGVTIKAVVEEHSLGKKLTLFKYKRRKGFQRKQGHRQKYSLVRIQDIATPPQAKRTTKEKE